MTLILNVLHEDMSVLAADKMARAEWSISPMSFSTVPPGKGYVVHDFNKVTMNSSRTLALGIAGLTQDHGYTQKIAHSEKIDDALRVIRKHIEGFVPIYDRSRLRTLSQFSSNEGIATFFDQSVGNYYAYKYLFSPIEFQARLHRGTDEVKILFAGSGSKYLKGECGQTDIAEFISSSKNSCTLEECMSWMNYVYKRVNQSDPEIGDEPVFLTSTKYSSFEYGEPNLEQGFD